MQRLLYWVLALLIAASGSARAQGEFRECVVELERRAVEAGISSGTAGRVLAEVRRLDKVVEADRNQPEFVSTFADYLNRRVNDERVATGRERLAEHRGYLIGLTERYGVPGRYIVALWGIETNYGRLMGDTPVFDALATLACDGRRSGMFGRQLIEALKIVERGDVEPGTMIGSWAGAMGQSQFMPGTYLNYAVDGDYDGRADLWNSTADALASIANYLSALGWERGLRWGREVRLPDGFDYLQAGRQQNRPLSHWRSLGVRNAWGHLLPDLELAASVLIPSGHTGPAFVIYDNFDVIMRWNRSEYFALVVGHLADRIVGAGPLRQPPEDDGAAVTSDQLTRVQQRLNELGYDSGEPDGIPGPATRSAVRAYERDHGMIPDGHLDAALLRAVLDEE